MVRSSRPPLLPNTLIPGSQCGGAQARKRPTSLRRRRTHQNQTAGPSNHTGAQTAKKRKAGARVTAKGTFRGSGRALNDDVCDEEQKRAGSGFRRKAGSKRAREERALAAERRLRALQGGGACSASGSCLGLLIDLARSWSLTSNAVKRTGG